jgi:transcriptional regulator with XRE-family HTH domain
MAIDRAQFAAQFGDRLRYYRRQRGLTQQSLADQAGLPRSYVGHLETGQRSNPSMQVLLKLLYALDVSLSEFFAPFAEVIDPFTS